MYSDVIDLREFYRSRLGRHAQRTISRTLRKLWPKMGGERLLAVGFGPPFLAGRPECERIAAAMPARQGVLQWPREGDNLTVLVDETRLPFADASYDKILLVHALEGADRPDQLLEECWRVLTNSGSLIIIVPNRSGAWARNDITPFGQGVPYSRSQLDRLLRQHLFDPVRHEGTLFVPPGASPFILSFSALFQKIGASLFPRFCGLIIMEAHKRLYAARPWTAAARLRPAAIVPVTSA